MPRQLLFSLIPMFIHHFFSKTPASLIVLKQTVFKIIPKRPTHFILMDSKVNLWLKIALTNASQREIGVFLYHEETYRDIYFYYLKIGRSSSALSWQFFNHVAGRMYRKLFLRQTDLMAVFLNQQSRMTGYEGVLLFCFLMCNFIGCSKNGIAFIKGK
jgi:hypothetical protein